MQKSTGMYMFEPSLFAQCGCGQGITEFGEGEYKIAFKYSLFKRKQFYESLVGLIFTLQQF